MLDDASAKCWGKNDYNQLGNSGGTIDVGAERSVVAISAGDLHTCAVLDDRSATTLYPQPSTLNLQPLTNPQPSTFNPSPCTFNPQPSTLNPQPSTLNPQPSTLNPAPSTLDRSAKCWGKNDVGQLGYAPARPGT